jgi:hypothetical protein
MVIDRQMYNKYLVDYQLFECNEIPVDIVQYPLDILPVLHSPL